MTNFKEKIDFLLVLNLYVLNSVRSYYCSGTHSVRNSSVFGMIVKIEYKIKTIAFNNFQPNS